MGAQIFSSTVFVSGTGSAFYPVLPTEQSVKGGEQRTRGKGAKRRRQRVTAESILEGVEPQRRRVLPSRRAAERRVEPQSKVSLSNRQAGPVLSVTLERKKKTRSASQRPRSAPQPGLGAQVVSNNSHPLAPRGHSKHVEAKQHAALKFMNGG